MPRFKGVSSLLSLSFDVIGIVVLLRSYLQQLRYGCLGSQMDWTAQDFVSADTAIACITGTIYMISISSVI